MAVPLSMDWDYESGIAKKIVEAAGEEVRSKIQL